MSRVHFIRISGRGPQPTVVAHPRLGSYGEMAQQAVVVPDRCANEPDLMRASACTRPAFPLRSNFQECQ